ncbi:MAG TPA: hypothetical protein VF950_19100 [Planctomycetota bacterium]
MNLGLYDIAHRLLRIVTHEEKLRPPRRERRSTSIPAAPARGFTLYRDPAGRFELRHPSEWAVENGPHFHSRAMGSFARVLDVEGDPFPSLAASFQAAGGRFEVERSKPGRAWGLLEVGGRRFAWDATLRDGLLLLIGNVVDAARGAALETYEDRSLAALRRSFKTSG